MMKLDEIVDALEMSFDNLDDDCDDVFGRVLKSTGCRDISEIGSDNLLKPEIKKKHLAEWLVDTFDIMNRARQALRIAKATIDKLQNETISDKASIISLQNVLIEKQNSQLREVSQTVHSEMKSYCDIVKQSCGKSGATTETIRKAVKSVAEEEDRSKKLLVFGLTEEKAENLKDSVTNVFESVGEKPSVMECVRIGSERPGTCRPVSVTLRSADMLRQTLRQSSKLKKIGRYSKTYLAPERTKEERETHKKLVEQMKEKIKSDSSKYHYIRGKTVVSVERTPIP